MSCQHAFSCAWCRLHVFALSSDWFFGLSASLVIGQSDYFGFGFFCPMNCEIRSLLSACKRQCTNRVLCYKILNYWFVWEQWESNEYALKETLKF